MDYNYWESVFPEDKIVCYGRNNFYEIQPTKIANFLNDELKLRNYLLIVRYNQPFWEVYYEDLHERTGKSVTARTYGYSNVQGRTFGFANWYEGSSDAITKSLEIAYEELERIKCKCEPKAQHETYVPLPVEHGVWDKIDSNIHIMYLSQICNEGSRSIQQTKAQQVGNLTLAYIEYYDITKEFTYTWHCLKMDDNYSWTYYKQSNELMIFLLPNNVVLKDLEHPCGLVEFQSNEIYLYQTCHVKRPIGYIVSHELAHWILFQKYPLRPDIFIDWVHNTQDCWDSGEGCQNNLIVNGIPYTIMPKYP